MNLRQPKTCRLAAGKKTYYPFFILCDEFTLNLWGSDLTLSKYHFKVSTFYFLLASLTPFYYLRWGREKKKNLRCLPILTIQFVFILWKVGKVEKRPNLLKWKLPDKKVNTQWKLIGGGVLISGQWLQRPERYLWLWGGYISCTYPESTQELDQILGPFWFVYTTESSQDFKKV